MSDKVFNPIEFVLSQRSEPLKREADPVGFIFIPIILGAVISWLVERCLNDWFPSKAKAPNMLDTWRLKRACKRGLKRAEEFKGTLLTDEQADKYVEDAYNCLLQAGRVATQDEFDELQHWTPTSELRRIIYG